jgi:bifunctional non-homologous end joining protein LigD
MRPGSSAADGGSWTKSAGRAHIHRAALPRVQPIIPTWRKEPFDDPEWLFEFKYDGFRGLCYLERGRCRFISRNGNMLSRFDALADQVGRLLDVDEAIIDILWADGADLRSLPLDERRRRLQNILPKGSPIVSEPLSVGGRV